jgi:hypothetical protein
MIGKASPTLTVLKETVIQPSACFVFVNQSFKLKERAKS